jgi:hypothetical protein
MMLQLDVSIYAVFLPSTAPFEVQAFALNEDFGHPWK